MPIRFPSTALFRRTGQSPSSFTALPLRQRVAVISPNPIRPYSTPSTNSSSTNLRLTAFASVTLLASAYLLYQYESSSSGTDSSGHVKSEKYDPTFNITIGRSRDAQTHTFTRKTDEELEKMLKENENQVKLVRKGNPVVRWDTSQVGSNEPCEDRWATNLIPRKSSPSPSKSLSQEEGTNDLMLFSIIDGHAGDACSILLSKILHPTLAISLAGLQAGYLPDSAKTWKAWANKFNPLHWSDSVWTPENVTATLRTAFLQLDDNISLTPTRLIPTLSLPSDGSSPTARETLVALAKPAAAGAVAVTALVDAANDDIYIASVGDCRAVAGWQGADGKWRCDTLSEDMSGENLKEIERVRSEHPASERDDVIKSGRVLGGLQPTRAIGDAVYKWTIDQNAAIAEAFRAEGETPRPQRPGNFTPPYVTADPETNYRKLHKADGEKLRFIILATDGLWDRITSEEATLLTASYLSHPAHADIPKVALPNLFPIVDTGSNRPYPQQVYPQPSDQGWVYEGDENAATHLIRNSLAGADRKKRGELLSMHGDVTRWLRDDITVTVVFFDERDNK